MQTDREMHRLPLMCLGSDAKLHNELKKSRNYDINMLQEVKLGSQREHDIKIKYRHHNCICLASRTMGNCSSRFNVNHLHCKKDQHGQYLLNVIRYSSKNLLVRNYLGNPDLDRKAVGTEERFATEIERMKRKIRIDEINIGGDFNFVLHDEDTNMGRTKPRTEARWKSLIEDLYLYDRLIGFFDGFGLKITVQANVIRTDYLDILFDLESGLHRPFRKDDNIPCYINVQSNHPPHITRNLPEMISKRVSMLSSNEEVFEQEAAIYNEGLKAAGYQQMIRYIPQDPQQGVGVEGTERGMLSGLTLHFTRMSLHPLEKTSLS